MEALLSDTTIWKANTRSDSETTDWGKKLIFPHSFLWIIDGTNVWVSWIMSTWCLKITKRSHFTKLRAKRAKFTFWVDKKAIKNVNFGEVFFKMKACGHKVFLDRSTLGDFQTMCSRMFHEWMNKCLNKRKENQVSLHIVLYLDFCIPSWSFQMSNQSLVNAKGHTSQPSNNQNGKNDATKDQE